MASVLQSFLGGQQAGFQAQASRQGIAQRDLALEQQKQAQATGQQQQGQTQELQKIQFMNQAGRALLKLPEASRAQAFQTLMPAASSVGIPEGSFTPDQLTEENLQSLVTQTDEFLRQPESLGNTLERERLRLQELTISERSKLAERKPEIAGATQAAVIEAQRGRKAEVAGEVAAAGTREKSKEVRLQSFISDGISAAETLTTIKRSIDLLDTVKTGGFAAAALAAKQKLGIEGADEGELSANLGKAVLSQLRSTFGAAFTEREGERLERIESGFGKSAATNKRLLGNLKTILEREARRGLAAAKESGDEFSVGEINDLLSFDITQPSQQTPAQPQAQQPPAQSQQFTEGQTATNQAGQTIVFRNGQWVSQ